MKHIASDISIAEDGGMSASRQIVELRVDLNLVGRGLVAGAAVGLVVIGGGSRGIMRLVALMAGIPSSFTVTGTLGLLLMGTTIGLLLALFYLPVKRWVPFHWPLKGLLFDLVLACITVFPFLGQLEGEAALVDPWIGASLFALLPLAFSLTLASALDWSDRRFAGRAERRVSMLRLALYIALFALAFVSMASIVESARTPSLLRRALEGGGVPFHQVRDLQNVLFLFLTTLFLGLHALAFWLGANRIAIQWLSMGQLALAALLLRTEPIWPRLAETSPGGQGEWAAWLLLAFGFGVVMALMVRKRAQQAHDRCFWNWLIAGVALFGGGWLLVWLAVLTVPDLQLRNWTAVQTTFTVAPLMAPWLCLPAALIGATMCSADDELQNA